MAPLRLSTIWYRRLYVALFIVSLGYVALYALQFFSVLTTPAGFQVTLPVAIASTLVLITSATLFIMGEKITSFIPAYVAYLVLAIGTVLFIQDTGGMDSPFLVLWGITLFIAPVFGAYGWVPSLVLIGSEVAGHYLSGDLTPSAVITLALSSAVPLIIGIITWRHTSDDAASKNVKNLASQLSEVAAKSEIVINAIGDGVVAVDGKGVIQLINPAAQEVLGWGKQDALMLNYKSILKLSAESGEELAPAQDPIQMVLNTNQQARDSKLVALTNSGKKLFISLVASPIGEPGNGAIAVFRDITKERTEEREQAEFISTASHEMRTPVASIEGYLGLALNPNTASVDERGRDFILKAQEAAKHLGRLFQDLLDVSRSEDGRMQTTPQVVDVVEYAETIAQGLQQKAAEKGLELVFVPAQSRDQKRIMPVYYVNLDNNHIREVLNNLIENAIKYTPTGQVRVDVSGSDDRVVLSVQDTGLGIPAEDIPHLFQKFYRVNNMDRQAIGGTGLGLYLCRKLVEAMQGRLWVESTFGNGSTFFIELPRIDSQEATRLKEVQQNQIVAQAESSAQTAFGPPQPPAPPTQIPVTVVETPAPSVAPTPIPAIPTPLAAPAAPQPTPQPIPAQPATQPAPAVQAPTPAQPQPAQQIAPAGARPATTVPRGETLTREQINERVRQLEVLAQQQRTTPQQRQ